MLFTAILEQLSHTTWIDYENLSRDFSIRESMLKATLQQLCQMGYLSTTNNAPSSPRCKSCPFSKKCSSAPPHPVYYLTPKGLHYIHQKRKK